MTNDKDRELTTTRPPPENGKTLFYAGSRSHRSPSLVTAADETCLAFLPEWECDVCGGYDASAPIVCAPYNATVSPPSPSPRHPLTSSLQFDDLTPGSAVGTYNSAVWTNFDVARENPTTSNDITTESPPNYAFVPAGEAGNISFTAPFPFGRLYSLHFACLDADASLTACNITVTAKCQPTIFQPDPAMETTETFEVRYQPESSEGFVMGFPPGDGGGVDDAGQEGLK
ncbi:hypothetical protein PRZ48_012783 [Zasmidium cellare]|uniref:Uncharacterized protein n=1 Tax=Zasmidium cellare TaxID=395010 RepID=A0ABR0E654_ZASCE|nr:hypothetical protein PRZ48_012783 [Zasmidium cellare]